MGEYMDFKFEKELVEGWLKLLYEKSCNIPSFLDAIVVVQFQSLSDEERRVVDTLHTMYLNEISGKIKPPLSLEKLYLEVNGLH